ncbi:unnamed protein product, partial [Rotaria sordida]
YNFSQKLNYGHILILITCPLYLKWYPSYYDAELFRQIPRILLSPFAQWLISCHSNSIIHCSKDFENILRRLNSAFVRLIEWENVNISNQEFYNDYCRLVSKWSSLLSVILKYSSDDSNTISIKKIIVHNLYDFTLHTNVLDFMKTIPNLIPMLLQMTDVEEDATQLHTYRCLGKLMNETDIKTMANPNFVQHDQVKVELIKQNALPLLIRCIIEIEFDPIKVKPIVLEILLALSFNNDVLSTLRQNINFMLTIRNLVNSTNSNKSNLQRAAEALLWKLEKEAEAIAKLTNSKSYKYDIMISYSHSDRQLCYQIHERLIQDGFSVWIDRDNMYGTTMMAMAEAVENSEFILICMSDTYKQSVYCQSEAHYAFERRCHLIPLIMKPCYKPDGWLGIMKDVSNSDDIENEVFQNGRKSELPDCITQWTNKHVQSFFLTNGLDNTMLLLCLRLDGHRLLQFYEICMINRESMYQSLKSELANVHQKTLTISDYVTFLHEIQRYIPLTRTISQPASSSLPSSTV